MTNRKAVLGSVVILRDGDRVMRILNAICLGLLAMADPLQAHAATKQACLEESDPSTGVEMCRAALQERQWPIDELLDLLVAYGNHLRSQGDYDAALDIYLQGIAMSPAAGQLHAEAGRAHQLAGNDEAAKEAYGSAIRAGSANPAVLNNRGVAFLALGEIDAAVADFDAALTLDSGYGNAWNNRANAHCLAGAIDASVRDRIQALYAGRFTAAAAQAGLRKSGFYEGPADGIWGPDSEDASLA